MNFTISELCVSNKARELGIKNIPTDAQTMNNLFYLITECLQPLRDKLKKPVIVTSGYRCPQVNKAVGGVANSQHMTGQAADIHVNGMRPQQLIDFIVKSGIVWDELINEYDSWVHISYAKGKNRKQAPFKIG